MSQKRGLVWPLIWAMASLSCTAPQPPPNIKDPEAAIKIAGIKQAAEKKDRSSIPALIAELDSDDPAVRFFAIEALEKLAGERFGYDYYLDEEQRKPSIAKWQEWLGRQKDVQAPGK